MRSKDYWTVLTLSLLSHWLSARRNHSRHPGMSWRIPACSLSLFYHSSCWSRGVKQHDEHSCTTAKTIFMSMNFTWIPAYPDCGTKLPTVVSFRPFTASCSSISQPNVLSVVHVSFNVKSAESIQHCSKMRHIRQTNAMKYNKRDFVDIFIKAWVIGKMRK